MWMGSGSRLECRVCANELMRPIEGEVMAAKMSHGQAAKEAGVSLNTWTMHYENHVRRRMLATVTPTEIMNVKKYTFDKIEEAGRVLDRVITHCGRISKVLEREENEENTKLISAYVQLEKTAISGLKDLAVLEGEIKNAGTINIQNNIINVDKLMSIVMEEAPVDVKARILERMEKVNLENAAVEAQL